MRVCVWVLALVCFSTRLEVCKHPRRYARAYASKRSSLPTHFKDINETATNGYVHAGSLTALPYRAPCAREPGAPRNPTKDSMSKKVLPRAVYNCNNSTTGPSTRLADDRAAAEHRTSSGMPPTRRQPKRSVAHVPQLGVDAPEARHLVACCSVAGVPPRHSKATHAVGSSPVTPNLDQSRYHVHAKTRAHGAAAHNDSDAPDDRPGVEWRSVPDGGNGRGRGVSD